MELMSKKAKDETALKQLDEIISITAKEYKEEHDPEVRKAILDDYLTLQRTRNEVLKAEHDFNDKKREWADRITSVINAIVPVVTQAAGYFGIAFLASVLEYDGHISPDAVKDVLKKTHIRK